MPQEGRMSEQPNTPAPEAPAADAPKPTEPVATAPDAPAPPWGDPENFDAEKAWKLIENLRAEKRAPAMSDEDKAKLAEYDRLVEASKSDLEKAQEAAAKNEARATTLLTRAVKAEIKALAAESFADSDDAATALDAKKYTTPDGDIDTDAIKTDLADLLSRKPHWAKSTTPAGMKPNPAQGRSASPPLGIGEQIAAAQKAGDIKTAIRLKASQALNPNN